jgi:DNA adenine methylase
MKTTSSIKWHGGKHYFAKWIVSHFPKHLHYVEPYFGSGAVLFAKPKRWIEDICEVVSDVNSELTNFWKVLQDAVQFEDFRRLCEATPFSECE